MSKRHKPHYVPHKDREWVVCRHPEKNCTAMGYAGFCGWNTALDKCEYGWALSPEDIQRGVNSILSGFGITKPLPTDLAPKDEV
jgi:hypothetical protein